ncbi:uncharacterized protein V1516DRAFT_237841 [Lipomyces oligophaga]|uniref:uncharacterized protein n=1 Tax=Lipomyces oligophaga TaxID=45792 RepID=UPI0034D013BD
MSYQRPLLSPAQRINDLLESLKAEFENVTSEANLFRMQKEEFDLKSIYLSIYQSINLSNYESIDYIHEICNMGDRFNWKIWLVYLASIACNERDVFELRPSSPGRFPRLFPTMTSIHLFHLISIDYIFLQFHWQRVRSIFAWIALIFRVGYPLCFPNRALSRLPHTAPSLGHSLPNVPSRPKPSPYLAWSNLVRVSSLQEVSPKALVCFIQFLPRGFRWQLVSTRVCVFSAFLFPSFFCVVFSHRRIPQPPACCLGCRLCIHTQFSRSLPARLTHTVAPATSPFRRRSRPPRPLS